MKIDKLIAPVPPTKDKQSRLPVQVGNSQSSGPWNCLAQIGIDGDIAELYDVEVIPGFATPMAVSPNSPEAANLITWAARSSATASPSDRDNDLNKQN